MFIVRAQYPLDPRYSVEDSDRELVVAAGAPSLFECYDCVPGFGNVRTLIWQVPGFGQAVAMKETLNRLIGVNATFREKTTHGGVSS